MSSRPAPVPEDRRLLPPQPHTPRAPTISQTGIVGPTRPPAPIQRLQDPQTPMPRDSLALQTPSMQRQDPNYGGLAVIPRRPSLERDQRLLLPPGLSTSPGAHSTMSGQPSGPPAYMGRSRRDSSSPPAPSSMQRPRRESVTLPSQPSVQPTSWDPMSSASQPSVQPGRRDSVLMVPQPPPAVHRNSMNIAPQPPAPVRRATDPLPTAIPPPQAPVRRASESSPRGQGILVSTRVRFNDENLICPSPIPMHERRKGWHNRRGCVFLIPPPFFFFFRTMMMVLIPGLCFPRSQGPTLDEQRRVQTCAAGTGVPLGPRQLSGLRRRLDERRGHAHRHAPSTGPQASTALRT